MTSSPSSTLHSQLISHDGAVNALIEACYDPDSGRVTREAIAQVVDQQSIVRSHLYNQPFAIHLRRCPLCRSEVTSARFLALFD